MMDFPGGAITNIHVIDGFSNIYWRIYTEEPAGTAVPPEGPANGFTILKHLSRVKDLELRLRNLDCLVSCYQRRLGLWVFSATQDFDSLSPLCRNGDGSESSRLVLGSATLKVSASGSVTAAELMRSMSADAQTPIASVSGTQRSMTSSRPGEGHGNQGIIYAAFISAVAGAMCLQLVRRHDAIPLGSRTLFTAVERNGYDSPTIFNDSPTSVPSLTTLRIELTPVGKLIVSLHTISQHGITRLCGAAGSAVEMTDLEPGQDLWLAPTGTIARLVSTEVDQSALPSPSLSNIRTAENEPPQNVLGAKRKYWKISVLEWLGNVGFSVDYAEDEPWVEVEVSEPFYSRLAAESMRQSEGLQSSYPLRRILWPAKYCFRRAKTTFPARANGVDSSIIDNYDPVEFAEEWFATAGSRNEKASSYTFNAPREQQPKAQDMSTPRTDTAENIESLARITQYPDLQAASLVYPTPPDGALAQGFNNVASSDAFGEASDLGPSNAQKEGRIKSLQEDATKYRSDSDLIAGFATSTTLAIGSGLYDTNDDEDLFGEMNEKDFGSKGITDADFSFFDEPDFGAFDDGKVTGDVPAADAEQSPFEAEKVKPEPSTEGAVVTNALLEGKKMSTDAESIETHAAHRDEPKLVLDTSNRDIDHDDSRDASGHPSSADNRQTISPPLSPVKIKQILFPETQSVQSAHVERSDFLEHRQLKEGRKQSHYDPVSFQKHLSYWDRKYGADGPFWFSVDKASRPPSAPANATSDIPTIGFPRRDRRLRSITRDRSKTANTDQDTPMSNIKAGLRSASVSSDDTTDDSSDILLERGISPTRLTSLKRKRQMSEADDGSTTSSLEKLSLSADPDATVFKEENSTFLGNFLYIFSDWSLAGYFSVRQNQFSPVLTRKEDQIQLAQLMVDQITQSSLNHKLDERIGIPELENDTFPLRTFLEDTSVMGEIARLDLKSYVAIQENGATLANDGLAPRQKSQPKEVKGSITKLPAPHLRICRGKDYLEVLPPAISFWETFGLEPAHGEKDILAYCIHPHSALEGADAFLERLGLLYSTCSLGKHVRGEKSKAFERGLGSWNVNISESGYPSVMQNLKALCEGLGNVLSKRPPSKDNYVIYVINPFTHVAALADICSAFLQLFQKYVGGADRQQARQLNELVLQIVPMSFISSAASTVVPTQAQYLNLALEVYNRCPPRDQTASLMGCAPPVILAEPAPRSINFKLVSEGLSPLQEGKCLHLAFSRSADQRWVTVAWSDSTGSFQMALSYCLRSKGSSVARIIPDVRHEIWETTKDIMDKTQARWRIILVKTEPVDQEEIDAWTTLAERYNQMRPVPAELTIFSVDTAPDLYLELPPSQIQMSFFNPQSSSTPVTTPNPNAPSPDQFGNAATPTGGSNIIASASTPTEIQSVDPDSDTILIDACDESWGVILSHRLNNSPHLTEYRPALASGYLLRRKGTYDGDGVFTMSINLIYIQRPSSYEILLREVLGMYRDLATLARAKGITNVQRNTLPWHIATAIRGQEMLSYVL